MIGTRRLVRLQLMLLLIVLLPFTGYLWSVINHHPFVYLLAFVCAVLMICIEIINRLTEKEAKSMRKRLQTDQGDLAEWSKKLRDLDRMVAQISEENAQFRHATLDSSPQAEKTPPPSKS